MINFSYRNIVFSTEMSELKSTLDGIIKGTKTSYSFFYIQGNYGCGSTHVIKALYNELLSRTSSRKTIEIYKGVSLLETLNSNNETPDFIEKLCNASYLIIFEADSLLYDGNTNLNNVIKEILYSRLNSKKITLLSGIEKLNIYSKLWNNDTLLNIKSIYFKAYYDKQRFTIIKKKSNSMGLLLKDEEIKFLLANFYIRNNSFLLESILLKVKAIYELTSVKPAISKDFIMNEIKNCNFS